MVKIESEKLNNPTDKTKDIINKYVNEDSIKNPYLLRLIYFFIFFGISLFIIYFTISLSISKYNKFPYISVLLFILFYIITPYNLFTIIDSSDNQPKKLYVRYQNVFIHSMILYSIAYSIEVMEIISYEKIKKSIDWIYHFVSQNMIPKNQEPILTKENVNQIDNLVTKIQGSIGNASKNLKSISNKINPSDISLKPIIPSSNPVANYSNFKFNNSQ